MSNDEYQQQQLWKKKVKKKKVKKIKGTCPTAEKLKQQKDDKTS